MPVTPEPIRFYPKSIADLDRLFRGIRVSTDPNTVGETELKTDAVTADKVADDAVTTDKIADSAVTLTKLAAPVTDDEFLVKRAGTLVYGGIVDTDIPATLARDSEVAAVSAAAADDLAAHVAAADPHPTYTTAAELATALSALNLSSGVYTPTRSAEANLDSNVTISQAQYLRVGNTVTVSGRFTADPTLATTTTSFEGTLPIASNIGAAEDISGTAFCGNIAAQGAEIIGVVANDTFKVQWKSGDVTSQTWSYVFVYRII